MPGQEVGVVLLDLKAVVDLRLDRARGINHERIPRDPRKVDVSPKYCQ